MRSDAATGATTPQATARCRPRWPPEGPVPGAAGVRTTIVVGSDRNPSSPGMSLCGRATSQTSHGR